MSNVVLLMSDEHNPFFSSPYGHHLAKTPNMEKMARDGTIYQNAYTPSPLCVPARCAFFAGRYVHEIQTYSNCTLLLKYFPTYGEDLAKAGVYTAYFGKTDGYAHGEQLGFSEMHLPRDRKLPGDVNFRRKPLSVRPNAVKRANQFGVRENAFDDDNEVMESALNWLEYKATALKQPFVLTISLLSPHFPAYATQKYWNMYEQYEDMPEFGKEHPMGQHPYALDLKHYFSLDGFTAEQTRGIRQGYLARITYVDHQIGCIRDVLKKTGLYQNTDFIYTSDHGDMMGKFGLWWKCVLFEDAVRVPCIAAGPSFQKGESIETPVDLLDVQASFFASVNTEIPSYRRGIPLQLIPKRDPNRVVFSEYHGHGTRAGSFLLRKGDYKLIYCNEAPNLLFNLKKDPNETQNLFEIEAEKAKEMITELYNICDPEVENNRAQSFQEQQINAIIRDYPERAYKVLPCTI